MALLATSQITIVDLNDAVSLSAYLTSTAPKVQFVTNNGTYTPNYQSQNVTISAELYRMGTSDNLISNNSINVKALRWYYKLGSATTWTQITASDSKFALGGTAPKFHSISMKSNLMTKDQPGLAIKCEMDYHEKWMVDGEGNDQIHTQKVDIDYSLTVQGDNGIDSHTVLLSNDSHTVICNANGVPESGEIGRDSRASSDISVYRGSTKLTPVDSSAKVTENTFKYRFGTATGCTAGRTDNDTFHIASLSTTKSELTLNTDGTGAYIDVIEEDGDAFVSTSKTTVQDGGKIEVIITVLSDGEEIEFKKLMTWSRVKHGNDGADGRPGANGQDAKYIFISSQSGQNTFKYDKNSTVSNPTSIILERFLHGIDPNGSTTKWQYRNASSWTNVTNGTSSTLTIRPEDAYFTSQKSVAFRCVVNDLYTDEFTISILKDGDDSYTASLSNESHTVVAHANGEPKSGELAKATTDIKAFKGITGLNYTTSTPGLNQFRVTKTDSAGIVSSISSAGIITISSLTADSATVSLDILCENKTTIKKVFSVSKARDGREGQDSFAAYLTNEFHSVPTNSSGGNGNYAGCATTIKLMQGSTELTASNGVTYTSTIPSGVTATGNGTSTITVTNMTVDIANITLTATHLGKSYSKTFTVSKNKQGMSGSDGTDGQDATFYWLEANPRSINVNKDGIWTTKTIQINSKRQTGLDAIQDYPSRFKIQKSNDGINFSDVYTSASDQHSHSYTIADSDLPAVRAIKVLMYKAGGTTTLLDQETINITRDGNDGSNGRPGDDAQYVIVSGESTFKYQPGYGGTPTPSSITLSRSLFHITGGKWQHYNGTAWVDFAGETGQTLVVNHNHTGTLFATAANKSLRVRYYVNDNVKDELGLVKLADGQAGADAYTVLLTNESCTIPTNHDGGSPDFSKATTDVIAYKGASKLSNSGFTIAKGTVSGCDVTVDNANKRVTFTAISSDSASAKITVTIDNKTFEKVFSATRAKKAVDGAPAKLITLNATSQTFVTNKAGTVTPSSITVTGTPQNLTGTTTYAWTKSTNGGAFNEVSGTTPTRTVDHTHVGVGQSCTYKLTATNSGNTYEDTITIVHLREGTDGTNAFTVVMTNESATVPANNDGGSPVLSGTATDIIVYKGSSQITNYTLAVESLVGCTVNSDYATTKKITLATMTADTASYKAKITVEGQVLYKVFSAVKSKKALNGTAAKLVTITGEQIFKYPGGASTPTNTNIVLNRVLQSVSGGKWQFFNSKLSTPAWADFNPTQTGDKITITHNMANTDFADASKKQMRVRYIASDNATFDEMTLVKVQDGAEGISPYTFLLTNPSHTIIAENNGSTTQAERDKAITGIAVYKGTQTITSGITLSVVSNTSGVTFTPNTSNNTIKLNAMPDNVDSATAEVTVVVGGVTLKQIFSVSKAKKGQGGASAKVIDITGQNTFTYNANGGVVGDASITLRATSINFTLGAAGDVIWTDMKNGAALNGVTAGFDSTTKECTLVVSNTSTSFSGNILTIKGTSKADSKIYDTFTITKVYDGKNALSGYVWGPQGNTIKNGEMDALPVEAVLFNGTSNVSMAAESKFKWVKITSSGESIIRDWTAGNASGNTISINAVDIPNLLVVKCYMEHRGSSVLDTIVLEDIADPIQATIFSTAGDTFKNGVGETQLVARLIRNGEEIDHVEVVEVPENLDMLFNNKEGAISFVKSNKMYYKYQENEWNELGKNIVPEIRNANSKFNYTWYKYNEAGIKVADWTATGKVITVTANQINQKASFVVEVED